MLAPKKTIPRLAIAALPLTGFGCGQSSGSETSEALAQSLQAYCMKLIECYGGDYSAAECAQYYLQYYTESYTSAACINAYTSYFNCAARLTCEQFVIEDEIVSQELAACLEAFDSAAAAVCPPVGSPLPSE